MDEEQEDLIPVEFMQDDAAVSRSDCRCEAGGHRGHAHHEAAPFERHIFQDDVHRKRQGHPRADALQWSSG